MADNKSRVIFLEHYLLDNTDREHPVTTEDLIALLAEKGYSANRNTIRSDIEALQEAGVQVAAVRVGNAKGYYIAERPFQVSELKALIDSVSASQFFPERKSREMIRHLAELAPEMYRKDLIATAFCTNRIKTENPVSYLVLGTIGRAIREEKKLSFRYADYRPDKEEFMRHGEKRYLVSPYAFVWNDGRYYVPSYDEEKGKIVAYRVDRMRNVKMEDEKAERGKPFDPTAYGRKILWMYDGDAEEEDVVLLSENRHMISLIDRFGTGIRTDKADENHFQAIVKVIPSLTFFSWIFQFNGEIRIIAPGNVRKAYDEMLRNSLARQEEQAGGRK